MRLINRLNNNYAVSPQPDYALEFNGTDEYLQIALPAELAGFNPATISGGNAPTGWTKNGVTTITYETTESGSSGCMKCINGGADYRGILKIVLTINKKYKFTIRYKSTVDIWFGNTISEEYKRLKLTSEWNNMSFVYTPTVNGYVFIGAMGAGTFWIESISIKEDQGFDLNKDQEMILHSKNWDFEGSTTDWAGTGNHSVSLSTLDKSSGTQSLLVSASGAGSSGSNYVSLPSVNLESCVSGKKYTLQGEARLDPASLTYGANLLTDDGTSGWTAGYGTGSVVAGEYVLASTGTGYLFRYVNSPNNILKVTFKAKADTYTGGLYIYHQTNSGTSTAFVGNLTSTYQTFTVYLVAKSTQQIFYIQLASSHTGNIYFDDIAIQGATPVTVNAQLGTKSVTSSALSIVSGTFTKFVLNFEATASEVNQDLKLWLSGAGSVFVDKLSLTQAYDSQTYLKIYPTETAKRTIYNIDANNFLEFRADGKIGVSVSDGTNTVTNIAEVAYTPNEWIELLIELNRTGNVKIIKGTGTPTGTAITTVGKIIKTSTTSGFRIGANASAGETLKGQIAKMIRTRYDNLTGYSGSEEMLRVTFQDGSSVVNCLKDYSPKAHTVSGVLVDITNRKRVTR